MTTKNTTRPEVSITEGQEYAIAINGKIVYTGIAESDTEAQENLENYLLLRSVKPVQVRLMPL